jgi:hypothetical protein
VCPYRLGDHGGLQRVFTVTHYYDGRIPLIPECPVGYFREIIGVVSGGDDQSILVEYVDSEVATNLSALS